LEHVLKEEEISQHATQSAQLENNPPFTTYLEKQKSVSLRRKVRLALGLVRPVDNEGSETPEARRDLLCRMDKSED
jgi:hypothetical protein